MDNSYNNNSGRAKPIWVIGSGGVKIAAIVKIITTTYFLLSLKYSELTTPILANKLSIIGNWKLIPNAKISLMLNRNHSWFCYRLKT